MIQVVKAETLGVTDYVKMKDTRVVVLPKPFPESHMPITSYLLVPFDELIALFGSWLKSHRSWLMAKGGPGQPLGHELCAMKHS